MRISSVLLPLLLNAVQVFFCERQNFSDKHTSVTYFRITGSKRSGGPFAAMKPKKKKGKQKPKLNITLGQDTKQKLAALAELEKRSVSNLIEIMADERWERLAEREGIDYAKTVAEIAGLKGLNTDKDADRKLFRREILKRVLKYKKR